MEKALFDDLVQSLKEAKAIARGETPASRRFKVTPPDVKVVREQIGLSQSEFARLMRVSVRTLQNWEQHRRSPRAIASKFKTSKSEQRKMQGGVGQEANYAASKQPVEKALA